MNEPRFATAYQHAAEQAMSDERVLGALPEENARALLDWQIARLRAAADEAATEEEFSARAEAIRAEARRIADSTGEESSAADFAARLAGAAATAGAEPPAGGGISAPHEPLGDAPALPSADARAEPGDATEGASVPPVFALGLMASPPGGQRPGRRRGRRPQRSDEEVVAEAATAGAAVLDRAGRAVRRRPWIALVALAVLLVFAGLVALVLLESGEERPTPSTAPPPGGGWYEAMFTTPQRTGTPPPGSSGRLDERLVELIDGAERSVDIAAYDFGLENVAEALIAARKRGVSVRVVTDGDNADNAPLKKLREADIPVVEDGRRALMHHKFAVIDGRTVMMGAWNFAERDTFRHNNNSVVWHSPELARNFTNEFEKMFAGRRFGPTKPKDVPNPVVEREGTRVETYFASEQEVEPAIADRLRRARTSIAFMAFSFTLDGLATVLEERSRDGVGIWGVFEATASETEFSEFRRLRSLRPAASAPPFPGCKAGPAVVQDGNPFLMHHKVFVIDGATLIFGSFNFTSNAAEDNDEALLIVDDPALASLFLAEFCRVYNTALERPARSR